MSSVALWLDPLSDRLEADLLFDASNTPLSGERILEPYVHVRERLAWHGIPVHTGDLLVRDEVPAADVNIYATMGLTTRYRTLSKRADTVLSAFLVNECPIVEPRLFAELDVASDTFLRLYSFAPDAAMEPFLKRPLTFRPFRYPYPFSGVADEAWLRSDRAFLVVINGNKVPRLKDGELYTERLRAIEYFSRFDEIDLYGVGWNGPPFRVGETRVPRSVRRLAYRAEKQWDRLRPERDTLLSAARRVYRGPVHAKSDTLAGYTFSICFENMAMEGWITEKIFDCLRAGTVPVYLGAPDVEHWVSPECFIDMRRFSDFGQLREFLHQLSPTEIEGYRTAGGDYLASDQFRPFTKEAFADIFEGILREDAGVAL